MPRDLLYVIDFELLFRCGCSEWLGSNCPCGARALDSLRGIVGDGAVAKPACRHSLPFLRPRRLRCIECGRESTWDAWWG